MAYHENGDYEQTDEGVVERSSGACSWTGGNEMSKRLLNCVASDFRKMTGKELKKAIEAAEGRAVCCETNAHVQRC